ncbi:MAG: SulP family inorganic anion transporter [Candidatus Nanopelagicales bacterium]
MTQTTPEDEVRTLGDRVRDRVPALTWLPAYRWSRISRDLVAGLVVAALAVPQALGYAGIAGVPVQVGLYAIPGALVMYALLGTSRTLFLGPVSTVSVLSGTLVAGMLGSAAQDPARAMALTSALALSTGLVLLVAGLLRLGWAAEFLSRPIITGFVFGLVILIILGELPSLLGLPAESGGVLDRIGSLVSHITDLNPLTAAIGVGSLAVLFLGARFAPRFPWGLLLVVAGIVASNALDLAGRGVAVIGYVPDGLPPIGLPGVGVGDFPAILAGGAALALVGLGEGLSAARLFASRSGAPVSADQEFLATGAANLASGFTGGLGVAGSLSKTAAADRSGARSQMYSLVAAAVVVVVLLAAAGLLSGLPRTVLSAIVIQAVWGLMDVPAMLRYRRIRRNDFVSALAALLGVLVLGPLYGLLAAVAQSVLGLVYRSSRVDIDVMGKVPGEKAAWGSVARHPDRVTVPGILVLRLDSPLFWVDAAQVRDAVLAEVARNPGTVALLLDLEATNQLDTTSVDMMFELLKDLREQGVRLYLVRVFHRARGVLRKSGFEEALGRDRMWHSISQGVKAARKDLGLKGQATPTEGAPELARVGAEHAADGTDSDGDEGPDYDPHEERIAVDHHHDGDDDEDENERPAARRTR